MMAIRIQRGSGNVFRDLGFAADEAAHLLIRTDLMIAIRRVLKERKLTQVRAAKLLGITQPRVSDLVRGRIDLFSIDALVDFLARLGVGVTVRTTVRKRVA
jgi:predicted XRE-type DNA-binding protein